MKYTFLFVGSQHRRVIGKRESVKKDPRLNIDQKSSKGKVAMISTSPKEQVDSKVVKIAKATEINMQFTNIKEIIKNTNATPIKGYNDMGYMCCYCPETFLKTADLKTHTSVNHHNIYEAYFMRETIFNYHVKLDITDLLCKLCGSNINTLEDLMDHLQSKHDIKLYRDIKNHIIPFKFDTESLQCFICFNVFNKFRTLAFHMSIHYRNYVCEVCDMGFINQRHLSAHRMIHKGGSFKCDFCPKVYGTRQVKRTHEKMYHSNANTLKCGYCSETFRWYINKEKHLAEVHNIKTGVVKCQACEKTFGTRANLTAHVKRHHLIYKPYVCEICDMKFGERIQLMNHMVSHGGDRVYKCEICLKGYARLNTLRDHMKIHSEDNRFKCEHCDQEFVQKGRWKGHMRSKHGELV